MKKRDLRWGLSDIAFGVVMIPMLAAVFLKAADRAGDIGAYVFRPEVFADLYLGPGAPSDSSALKGKLWYLRFQDHARARLGIEEIVRMAVRDGVQGLDFSGNNTLTNGDAEALLSRLSTAAHPLYLLRLGGTVADDRAVASASRLFDLLVLETPERVTDTGLALLRTLHQLRVLHVPAPQVTDVSVPVISRLTRLERLDLQQTAITDRGLQGLQHLRLKELNLGPAITNAGIKALVNMKSLQQLDLHRTQVGAKGLTALRQLPRLHTLFLSPSLTDRDIAVLADFKNLQRLDLTGARLSDASLPELGKMGGLEELALTQTPVTDAVFRALASLPKLRYLELSGTRVTPEGLKTLQGFPSLQVLSLSSPRQLTLKDLEPLVRLSRLHTLILNGRPIGRDLLNALRDRADQRSQLLQWLVAKAYAGGASEKDLEKALELASLPAETLMDRGPSRQGLRMIHEVESNLDEIITAPTMIHVDNQEDTEKNFLGEFTVGAESPKSKARKGLHHEE